jgi:hypothetical protein
MLARSSFLGIVRKSDYFNFTSQRRAVLGKGIDFGFGLGPKGPQNRFCTEVVKVAHNLGSRKVGDA